MASSAQIHALFSAAHFRPSSTLHFSSSCPSFVGFHPSPAFTSLRLSQYIPSRYGGPVRVAAEKVVRVDLGTTNSVTAVMEGGKPTIITNTEGQRTTSSVVAYTKNGDRLIGQIVKRKLPIDSSHRCWSFGTVVVVTVSNRGIGFEIARQLAEHGLTVIVASRDPVQGRAATDGLREHGLSVDWCQLDVSDAALLDRLPSGPSTNTAGWISWRAVM